MINCFADIYGHTGYAKHARNFFMALGKHTPVCLVPKNGKIPENSSEELLDLLQPLLALNPNDIAINLDYGIDLCRFGGKKRIAYTVFETDRLPCHTISILNGLDEVWAVTDWAAGVMAKNGIPHGKIRVVPEGTDTAIFRPGLASYAELLQNLGFRFLTVGKWETRKGMRELLLAFDRAFAPTDDAWLVAYLTTKVEALKSINLEAEIASLNLKNRNRLLLITSEFPSDLEMARLYNSCHCFVSAAKAEGWGLPIMEAMACGLPVIAARYSGPSAYLTRENSLCFDVTDFEDAHCPVFFPNRGEHGRWARITVDALAQQMRVAYDNRQNLEKIGQQAAKDVQTKWTWAQAAQTAYKILKS